MAKSLPNITEVFPLLTVDEEYNIVVSKNADLSVVFEVELPEIYTMDEGDYEALHMMYLRAIKVFPPGYMVHKQDWFFEDQFEPSFGPEFYSTSFINQENQRHFNERPYTVHKTYITVTLPAQSPLKRNSSNNSLFKKMGMFLRKNLIPREVRSVKYWEGFMELCTRFQAILNDSGRVRCTQLKGPALVGVVNGDDVSRPGLFHQYLNLSLHDPTLRDLDFDGNMKVGGKNCYTFAISRLEDFPSEIADQVRLEQLSTDKSTITASTGSMLGLFLPFNHVYNQVLFIEEPDSLIRRLVAEVKRHLSFSAWSKENEVSIYDKNEFMEAIKGGNRTVVCSHYNVMTFHQDPDIADQYRSKTAAAIAKLGYKPYQAELEQEALFWACIPGNIAEIGNDNLFTCLLDESIALWTMETHYKDPTHNKHGVLMTDRFGRPVMVDLILNTYPKYIDNRNVMVVGPSGSGKSFTMNNLVYYLRENGAHVTIVDIGNSYKRLCEVMGGNYVNVDENNRLEFNPFYFANLDPTEEQQDAIRTLINVLWKGDIELTSDESTGLTTLIQSYYKYLRSCYRENNPKFPSLNTLYEFAQGDFIDKFLKVDGSHWNQQRFDIQSLLWNLKKFYRGETYDYLLNSEKNLDLINQPFTIFELDNIKDNPTLYSVVTLMIMNTYVNKLFQVSGTIKVLIIEEAWQALSKANFSRFLLWCAKTCRKHNGSLVVVTQEVDDLIKSSIVKDALVNNCDVKLLLDQSKYKERFDEVKSVLALSDTNANFVLSVNGAKDYSRPPYKECAVILKDKVKVYGIEVSTVGYGSFTTNRTEVEEIKALINYFNGNTEEGIRAWAKGQRVAVEQEVESHV